MFEKGDKVTYVTKNKKEHGIVKKIYLSNVFVVYHCGDNWENYTNYTAALTDKKYLVKGWV